MRGAARNGLFSLGEPNRRESRFAESVVKPVIPANVNVRILLGSEAKILSLTDRGNNNSYRFFLD